MTDRQRTIRCLGIGAHSNLKTAMTVVTPCCRHLASFDKVHSIAPRTTLSDRTKLLILVAAIAAILYVLISPLPEMDATHHCRVIAIAFPTAVVAHLAPLVLAAIHEIGESSPAKDTPELLAILCVRHC